MEDIKNRFAVYLARYVLPIKYLDSIGAIPYEHEYKYPCEIEGCENKCEELTWFLNELKAVCRDCFILNRLRIARIDYLIPNRDENDLKTLFGLTIYMNANFKNLTNCKNCGQKVKELIKPVDYLISDITNSVKIDLVNKQIVSFCIECIMKRDQNERVFNFLFSNKDL